MTNIGSILCPIDFSDCSRHALAHARMIARRFEALLTVVYVAPYAPTADSSFSGYSMIPLPPRAREQLVDDVRRFADDIAPEGPAPRIVVREGDPVTEIVAEAGAQPVDLTVLGTHGRSGFERLWLGSVAERVVRKLRGPVLTVPPRATALDATTMVVVPYTSILCPVDFSDASIRALDYALGWAQEADATLTLLHVLEPNLEEGIVGASAHLIVPEYYRYLKADAQKRLDAMIPVAAREWCTPE